MLPPNSPVSPFVASTLPERPSCLRIAFKTKRDNLSQVCNTANDCFDSSNGPNITCQFVHSTQCNLICSIRHFLVQLLCSYCSSYDCSPLVQMQWQGLAKGKMHQHRRRACTELCQGRLYSQRSLQTEHMQ